MKRTQTTQRSLNLKNQVTQPTKLNKKYKLYMQLSQTINKPISTLAEILEMSHIIFEGKKVNTNNRLQFCKLKHQENRTSKSRSIPETKMVDYFNINYCEFKEEITLPYNKYRYDFAIKINRKVVLIEIDGEQHFTKIKRFIPEGENSDEYFKYKQNKDRIKTELALISGYKLIRIHWKDIKNIENIMTEATFELKSGKFLYMSRPKEYKYIIDNITLFDISNNVC